MGTDVITAVIDLDLPGPTISRHLYGHFAEHLGRCIYGGFFVGEDSRIPNADGLRLDVVEALRAIRIPNLRWPGGCFADDYHWRDGVGPREQRPRMVDSHWGDVVEDNSFGTHEFMALCELLGADPYVNGNVGSGTVREMSEWVEYLTRGDDSPMAALRRANGRDEPWRVPFWGIGNEPWGCGGHMSAAQYASLARRYSTYVRDHAGNEVHRIAAGADADDLSWTETLMQSYGCVDCSSGRPGPFQGLSLHYYTMSGSWADKGSATVFDEDEWYLTLARAARVEWLLRRHSTVMDRYDPAKKVGLVLDEWGTWWNVEPGTNPGFLYQQNTLRDALVASTHFDAFHRHADRLVMANIAQTVNVLQAMILTDPGTGALVLTPTYHVFEMNVAHHDAASLAVHLRGVPTREADGRQLALVSLSNLDVAADRVVVLDLRGQEVTGSSARILTAPALAAHNAPNAPDAVAPADHAGVRPHPRGLEVDLPAHSYVTVALDLRPPARPVPARGGPAGQGVELRQLGGRRPRRATSRITTSRRSLTSRRRPETPDPGSGSGTWSTRSHGHRRCRARATSAACPGGAALFESLLDAEFGGVNEAYAELADLTGRADYAAMARRFSHRAILEPLLAGRDELTGRHANAQIPKVVGSRARSPERDCDRSTSTSRSGRSSTTCSRPSTPSGWVRVLHLDASAALPGLLGCRPGLLVLRRDRHGGSGSVWRVGVRGRGRRFRREHAGRRGGRRTGVRREDPARHVVPGGRPGQADVRTRRAGPLPAAAAGARMERWPSAGSSSPRSNDGLALDDRALDRVAFGKQQPESDHAFRGSDMAVSAAEGRHWRTTRHRMSVVLSDPEGLGRTLRVGFRTLDEPTRVVVRLAGTAIADETFASGDEFLDLDYGVADALAEAGGPERVLLDFAAVDRRSTPGVMTVRLLRWGA